MECMGEDTILKGGWLIRKGGKKRETTYKKLWKDWSGQRRARAKRGNSMKNNAWKARMTI